MGRIESVNGEILTLEETPPGVEVPIQFCEKHQTEMEDCLPKNVTNEQLANIAFRTFQTLSLLSVRAVGSTTVEKFKCPVCTFQQFDWIKETVKAIAGDRR